MRYALVFATFFAAPALAEPFVPIAFNAAEFDSKTYCNANWAMTNDQLDCRERGLGAGAKLRRLVDAINDAKDDSAAQMLSACMDEARKDGKGTTPALLVQPCLQSKLEARKLLAH